MPTTDLIPRFAFPHVVEVLGDTPVVVLQGARQVGKSTLVSIAAADRPSVIITLDDPQVLDLAREDPRAVVGQFSEGMLAIDEAQRAPELLLPIKANVDADRRPGRFLLTGSADLLQVRGAGDSLAGRAETVEILPFSQGEIARRGTPEDFVTWLLGGRGGRGFEPLDVDAVLRGGFPEVVKRTPARARAWLTSYATRLADHDARELAGRGYADQFGSLLRYFAAHGQAELVKASLARHLGVAESTVDNYWRLAKAMRVIVETPAWNRVPSRRVVKKPKAGLVDTGLAAALAGVTKDQVMAPGGREYLGALVEQFVALELAKQRGWTATPYTIHHLRDPDGLEIDLLLETDGGVLIAIEVKATTTPTRKHWKNLATLREILPDRTVVGVLLHAGDGAAQSLHGWLHILPITTLWQH